MALTVHSHLYFINKSTDSDGLTDSVTSGKGIWEEHPCINCHTILGEGAYFAPEVGSAWVRHGGLDDPGSTREALKAWMQSQPSGIEGRCQMPQVHLSDQELDHLIDFLEWPSRIGTQGWPTNDAG